MKSDKKKEIKNKSREELKALVLSDKDKLASLKFDLKSGKTANIKEISDLRKQVALILTILNQKQK